MARVAGGRVWQDWRADWTLLGEGPDNFLQQLEAYRFGRGEPLVEVAERLMLRDALRRSYGVQADAAELLGISSRVLNYRLEAYGVRPVDQLRDKGDNESMVKRRQRKKPPRGNEHVEEVVSCDGADDGVGGGERGSDATDTSQLRDDQ